VRARSASSVAALPLSVRWLSVAWASASLADYFVLWAVVWSAGLEGWSGAQTAGIIMAARAPAFVGGIAGGMAIDRYGARTLMVFDGVARTLVMLGLVVNGLVDGFGYTAAVILVLLAGATAPISYSAVRTFLPRLVPGNQLGAANTLLAIGSALPLVLSAGIVGPALELVGLAWAFLVPAILMVGVAVIALWLPTTGSVEPLAADSGANVLDTNLSPHAGRSPLTWRRVPAGTLALLCLSTAYFFAFGPVEPVLPLVVRDRLDAGATTYGLLWSTMGIGALLGLLVAPALTRMSRPGATMAGLVVLNGLAMLPLATTTGVGVSPSPAAWQSASCGRRTRPSRPPRFSASRPPVTTARSSASSAPSSSPPSPWAPLSGPSPWTRSASLPSSSAPASPASPSPSAPWPSPPSGRKSGTRLCLRIADLPTSSAST
jgi:MFS family permease